MKQKKFKPLYSKIGPAVLVIREAKPSDAKRLWEIQGQKRVNKFLLYPPSSFQKSRNRMVFYLKEEGSKTLVAVLDGLAVGRAFLRKGRGRASHVANFGIFVDENFHGRGIGTVLLGALFGYAKSVGVEKIEDEVFSDNKRGLRFYKTSGFKIEGRRKRKFLRDGKHHDSVLIGKFLN